MNGYTPIPFARPPIDQTAERLKLADLLYQANMARVQAEQERQMTYARMIAQTGQMIGSGIEDYLARQQRERALAIQAERENRMASAEIADAAYRRQLMARQERQDALMSQTRRIGEIPGGAEVTPDVLASLPDYASSFTKEVTPVLPSTPQTLSALAGVVPQAPAMEEMPSAMVPDFAAIAPPPSAPLPAETMQVKPTAVPTAPMERIIKTRTPQEQKLFDEEQRRVELEQASASLMQRIRQAETPEARRRLIEDGIASGVLPGAATAILNQERKPDFEEQTLDLLVQENLAKGMSPTQARISAMNQIAATKRKPDDGLGYSIPQVNQLSRDYYAQSKRWENVSSSYSRVLDSSGMMEGDEPSPAGDISMVFSYMKMLDPASTVMQGEQAQARNAAGVPDQIRNLYNRLITGKNLTPSQRADFVDRAYKLAQSEATKQRERRKNYEGRLNRMGIPADVVLPESEWGITSELPKIQGGSVAGGGNESPSAVDISKNYKDLPKGTQVIKK